MSFATGADIPPELIARIARICCTSIGDWDKHDRARCSLTCRYWAQLTRRDLFRDLKLKCAEDVPQLLASLDAQTFLSPLLRDCIGHLTLVDHLTSPGTTPWLHHFIRLRSKLRPDVSLSIHIVQTKFATLETDASPRTVRVVPYFALPKTIPSSVLRLSGLCLSNVNLCSVKSLIDSLCHLDVVDTTLKEVAFEDLSTTGLRVPRWRRHRRRAALSSRFDSSVTIVSDLLCRDDNFHSYLAIANLILGTQGCPLVDEHVLASLKDQMLAPLPDTVLPKIYISYSPRNPEYEWGMLTCAYSILRYSPQAFERQTAIVTTTTCQLQPLWKSDFFCITASPDGMHCF